MRIVTSIIFDEHGKDDKKAPEGRHLGFSWRQDWSEQRQWKDLKNRMSFNDDDDDDNEENDNNEDDDDIN